MVLGIIDWLVLAGAAWLGLKVYNEYLGPAPMPVSHPDIASHMLKGAIRHPLGPGDVIYMQNASPYNYEPDGNYL